MGRTLHRWILRWLHAEVNARPTGPLETLLEALERAPVRQRAAYPSLTLRDVATLRSFVLGLLRAGAELPGSAAYLADRATAILC